MIIENQVFIPRDEAGSPNPCKYTAREVGYDERVPVDYGNTAEDGDMVLTLVGIGDTRSNFYGRTHSIDKMKFLEQYVQLRDTDGNLIIHEAPMTKPNEPSAVISREDASLLRTVLKGVADELTVIEEHQDAGVLTYNLTVTSGWIANRLNRLVRELEALTTDSGYTVTPGQ